MPLFGLVQARSLIGLFNWIIKSDKSGRQAKTIRNVAGGNFTRGLRQGGNMAALPLAHSRILPATQARKAWKFKHALLQKEEPCQAKP